MQIGSSDLVQWASIKTPSIHQNTLAEIRLRKRVTLCGKICWSDWIKGIGRTSGLLGLRWVRITNLSHVYTQTRVGGIQDNGKVPKDGASIVDSACHEESEGWEMGSKYIPTLPKYPSITHKPLPSSKAHPFFWSFRKSLTDRPSNKILLSFSHTKTLTDGQHRISV